VSVGWRYGGGEGLSVGVSVSVSGMSLGVSVSNCGVEV